MSSHHLWLAVLLLLFLLVTPATAQRRIALHQRDGFAARLDNSTIDIKLIPDLLDAAPQLDHRDKTSLLSKILIPRTPGSAGSSTTAAALLEPFRALNKSPKTSLGWHIEELPFKASTPDGEVDMVNLVITKNPAAPRRLTLAAHYDSKVLPKGFIGATDSAAPCAIIVDVALALDRALDEAERKYAAASKDQPKDPHSEITLQVLLFDGEEAYHEWTHTDSIYGSRHIANNWTRTAHSPSHAPSTPVSTLAAPRLSHLGPVRFIDGIEHLVLLDLLGVPSPRIPSYFRSTAWMHSMLADAQHRMTEAGVFWPKEATNKREEKWLTASRAGGGIEDDHLPFLHNGVPILHLIPIPFPTVWHTMKDDASALDYPTMYGWSMLMRYFAAEYLGLDINSKAIKPRDEVLPRSNPPVVEIEGLPAVIPSGGSDAEPAAQVAHEELQ